MTVLHLAPLDPRARRSALIVAVILGATFFLSWGVVLVAMSHYYALDAAAGAGDTDAAERILDRHPERLEQKNKLGQTPLHVAVYEGHTEIVILLIRRGADVNAKQDVVAYGDGQWNPLHVAANYGRLECARILIGAGTNINGKSLAGKTPLDVAIRTRHRAIADLLRAHGGASGALREGQ